MCFRFGSLVFIALICLASSLFHAAAAEIQKDRLVLIKTPGKMIEAFSVASLEIQEMVVVTMDDSGKRSAWQRKYYQGSVRLFSQENSTQDVASMESILQEFRQLASKSPECKELIQLEQSKWQNHLVQLKLEQQKAAEEKRAQINDLLTRFFARSYNINEAHTHDSLRRHIELGESLIDQAPDRSSEISDLLKPWKVHLSELEAGKLLHEGEWITAQELKEQKDAESQAAVTKFLEQGLNIQMEAVVVPQTATLIVGGVIVITLVMVLYLFLTLASSPSGMGFGGATFLLVGLAIIGLYLYYGYKVFNAPSSIVAYLAGDEVRSDEIDIMELERALFVSADLDHLELAQTDLKVTISDRQVNSLLENNTDFIREGEAELFDMERVAFATLFSANRVVFLDEVVVFGKSFLIRYELDHQISDELISFDGVAVYFGHAKLPGQFLNYFWMNLRRDLQGMIQATGVSNFYQLSSITEGSISLVMTRRPQGVIKTSSISQVGNE